MAHKCMCYAWVFVGISLQLGGQIGPEESIVDAVIEPCIISRSQSHAPPVWLLFLLILLFSSSSPSPCHSTWVAFTLAFIILLIGRLFQNIFLVINRTGRDNPDPPIGAARAAVTPRAAASAAAGRRQAQRVAQSAGQAAATHSASRCRGLLI